MPSAKFKNVQLRASNELADEFQNAFEESGTNSRGEFLGVLLENYINPDHESQLNKLKKNHQEEIEKLTREKDREINLLKGEIDTLIPNRELVESYAELIGPLLEKFEGDKVTITNQTTGEKEEILIESQYDVFYVIFNSFKIK